MEEKSFAKNNYMGEGKSPLFVQTKAYQEKKNNNNKNLFKFLSEHHCKSVVVRPVHYKGAICRYGSG